MFDLVWSISYALHNHFNKIFLFCVSCNIYWFMFLSNWFWSFFSLFILARLLITNAPRVNYQTFMTDNVLTSFTSSQCVYFFVLSSVLPATQSKIVVVALHYWFFCICACHISLCTAVFISFTNIILISHICSHHSTTFNLI